MCPRDILVVKKDKITIDQKKLETCNLCMACVNACEPGAIEVAGDRKKILLTVDSFGQLDTNTIMKTGSDILRDKIGDFKKLAK